MKNKFRIKGLILTAVFSALLCVISPVTVPFGAIPFTLSVFAVCCVSTVLEEKAALSVFLYIVLGALGLPVFAAFNGGAGVLAGATGGFIVGYIPLGVITGIGAKKAKSFWGQTLLSLIGLAVCYIFGCVWYFITTGAGLWQGLTVCVFPFIIPDIIKIAAGVLCGRKIKKIIAQKR